MDGLVDHKKAEDEMVYVFQDLIISNHNKIVLKQIITS